MSEHNFKFFWSGPFSQWSNHGFEIEGIYYNRAEQFMMAQKALLFNDMESFDKIMATKDAKKQKALGRKVKNYNDNVWANNSMAVVLTASYFKFKQNKNLKQLLLDTGSKELVEASPYDRVWGIGLKEDDPRALNKVTWRGDNKLGLCLGMARDFLNYEIKHGEYPNGSPELYSPIRYAESNGYDDIVKMLLSKNKKSDT